ncbi:MAG: hypothetical protein RLZZ241_1904 [Bacteroidota bacterium]|jgi:adenosylmethionine-8-amino-7-oxononanoate aminotransferase
MHKHNIQPLLHKTYNMAYSATGVYITDVSGKRFLDGSSGPMACSLGHSHPAIVARIKKQLDKLQFVYRSQFGTEEAEQLAKKLMEISPNGVYQHSFFVNSGSEAIETALKIALQFWQEKGMPTKNQFITRQKSYHGITMGALGVSGHQIRRRQFENVLWQPADKLVKDLETDPLEVHLEELEKIISRMGSDRIAGVVLEPIIGASGTALVPPVGYYEAIAALCKEKQILFIGDEVMTGLGRTGAYFGLDHWGAHADIITLGKSLGAGYAPIAATLLTEEILEPIQKGSGLIMSGHTYSGHPLSCAAALEVLTVIEEDKLISNVNQMGQRLKDGLHHLQQRHEMIQTVRGKGLMLGVELNPEITGLQSKIIESCYDKGLLVYPSVGGKNGTDENGLLISPPFVISPTEIDTLLELLEASLQEVGNTL